MSTVRKDMDIRGADSKSRFHNDWNRDFYDSSVKCVDDFRMALTEEPKWFIQQKHDQDRQLSILSSSSDTKAFSS